MKLKAIIFDCFGVLATENWLKFKKRYFADKPELMERTTELNHMLDAGLMSYADFLHTVAGMAGIPPAELDHTLKSVSANDELLDYIARELKPHYKIGLLSNVADDWLYTLFTEEQRGLIDEAVLSHDIGVTKPHPHAYHTMAGKLGVETGACVFVDDQERNVIGARETGMQAVHYRGFEQFVHDIQPLRQGEKLA